MQKEIILSADFLTKITPLAHSIFLELENFSTTRLRRDLSYVTNLGRKIKALGEPAEEIEYSSLYSCVTSLFNRLEPLAFEAELADHEAQEIARTLQSLADGLKLIIYEGKSAEFLFLDIVTADYEESASDDPCFSHITPFHHEKLELVQFLNEAKMVIEKLNQVLEMSGTGIESIIQAEEFLNEIHGIKGTSSFFPDLRLNITKFCHEFESLLTHWIQTQGGSRNALPHLLVSRILKIFALLLENLDGRLNGDSVPHPTLRLDGCYEGFKKWKEGKPVCPDSILDPRMAPLGTDTLIKLPFTRLDQMVEEVHSLQLMVGKVQERFSNQNSVKQSLKPVLEGLNRLQTRVLDSRLFPIGLVFDRFLRTIRDHGHTLNKEVGCEIRGSDIQIDQNTANILSIPMTHLVRNSLDHGIESPTLRKTLGKPLPGLISFAAMQSSNRLIIEISDDGQGIHSDLSAAQDNNALLHNLTQLGYSSKAYITPNSGRGIGLYVAKREIEKHGGCLKLESKNGEFTKFTIELPLRFFVTDCILFRSDKQIFAVPLDHLQTVSSVEEYGTQDAEKNVKSLSKLINPSSQGLQENFDLELFNSQKETFHLRVEECLGKESLLIRSMDNPFLQSLPLTSAASVLHNGKLCWILDPNRLGIQKTERKYHLIQNTPENHDPHLDRIFSGANRGRVLCFQAGEKLYAIPLFYLKEVMDYKKPIRLPILPELILGLISLRGLPIPLVNLLALVSQYAANNEFECILILEHNGALTGIPTGKLSGIHTLQRQHLFFSHKSLSMPVIGSFKLRNSEVNLLNLEALIGQGINCCNNLDLGDES